MFINSNLEHVRGKIPLRFIHALRVDSYRKFQQGKLPQTLAKL